MNGMRMHLAIVSIVSIEFAVLEVLTPATAWAGIVPDGSRIFMQVAGNENICGPGGICAVAAGPTVPVSIPLTTFTDPRGANFGFITASASVTSGKTATGTSNARSSPFEFISINDTYTVHGTASGSFPITATLHVTGSYGTVPTSPPNFNTLGSFATQLEIGTFHPESTLTQFVVDPFPSDANNPTTAQVSQTHGTVTSPTPVTFPLDVQVSYTKIVNINDVFDLAYGIDLNIGGNAGQINMIPTTDVISFALPEGVFLTSALGATFGTPPSVPGDYNNNGVVDAADYVLWRNGGPLQNEVATLGTVTPEDYTEWRSRFGNTSGSGSGSGATSGLSGTAVPEPISVVLTILGMLAIFSRRRAVVS